jgi:hypothetical protein
VIWNSSPGKRSLFSLVEKGDDHDAWFGISDHGWVSSPITARNNMIMVQAQRAFGNQYLSSIMVVNVGLGLGQ